MVKLNPLYKEVKHKSGDYSIPIEVSFSEGESVELSDYTINDAERKLKESIDLDLLFIDFRFSSQDKIELSFRGENMDKLKGIIKNFELALSDVIKEVKEREIKSEESKKKYEEEVKETLEKIKNMDSG